MWGRLIGLGARKLVDAESKARQRDPVRWLITRGIVFFFLLVGWTFIAWQNKFHVTAPTFFLCVGYLAVVMTIVNLWRTGAAAMSTEDVGEWARPLGERGELEREKRTLLKAIKEAEFDHEMGKLSKVDADGMIQTYRARAIEVIKQLEPFEVEEPNMQVDPAGRPIGKLSVRDQIAREVKARLEVAQASKSKKKKGADKKPDVKAEAKAEEPKVEAKAEDPKAEAKAEEPKVDEPAPEEPKVESASEATS